VVGSTSLYQLPNAWRGMSVLVGIEGMEGIAIAGMDQAFNCVELPSELALAFPGAVRRLVFGRDILRASPEMAQLELNLRVRLDAADASTMASCAVM